MRLLKKLFLAVILLSLVAAACGGSSDSTQTTEPTLAAQDDPEPEDDPEPAPDPTEVPTEEIPTPPPVDPADLFDSAPGVTADTILVGYPIIDFDGLNTNFNLGLQYENYTPMIDAWVADFNSKGGLNGRMLEVLIDPYIPSDIFIGQAETICLKYTEDTQVFVVMEGFNGIPAVSNCVVDLHETMIVGSPIQPGQLATAKAPWISDEMMLDRRVRVFTQLMTEEAGLADLGPIFVIAPNDSYTALTDHIVAAYEAQGTEVKLALTLQNSSDEVAAREEMGVILERARTEGVSWLHIVAPMPLAEGPIFETEGEFNLLFSEVSSSASWSYDPPVALTAGTDMYRLGNYDNKNDFGMDECVRIAEEAIGIEVKIPDDLTTDETNWWPGVVSVCRNFSLFTQVAAWAGADLNNDTFQAAFEEHGDKLSIPGHEFASLSADKVDAQDTVQLQQWDFENKTWIPITDWLDVSDIS